MKGMQKIKRGKNFAGVVFYTLRPAYHHKNDPIVIGGNMDGSSAEDLIAEFNTTKALRPDVTKPVWHNSLRLPKNEALTDAQWSKIADDYMSRMGFAETHLRCYILHDDNEGQHIHIIASRIDLNAGKLYLGKNENLISTRIIQQLEHDYSLTRTKGLEAAPAALSHKPKLKKSRNELMIEKRTGELCPKAIIQNVLEELLANKPSTTVFVQQLAKHKIRVIPNIASTGRMNGFSFEYAGIAFKASQISKDYSWSALQDRIDYIPERDNAFLLELKASASENTAIAQEIATEAIRSPSETLISDNYTDENEIPPTASVKALLSEAVPNSEKAFATKVVKEAPTRSYITAAFRWLETIPYLSTIISLLKNLRIPLLRRPQKHKAITGMTLVEIAPRSIKKTIEIPRKSSFSM
ncbi:relaxase/mobilization nuclease domain-containing protein [Cedecea davisae]|uniref:relaxase/mobilization nuclease domain-containing protein n=1 Tax=Cedecea davisae TaxID=158484 RepID=UPI001D0B1851|nr:relaxase/mobilization nuclease domain-containing protein [Cedecea davisae]